MKEKNSNLKLLLTLCFVTCLLISNIVAGKQILLPFNITMTGAIIVFPIVYILSDVFSEVYGYKWSRITCYLAFIFNLFMVLIFEITIHCPAPEYWANQNAFETVLGNTPRMLMASLMAFILGDFINDKVFDKMKQKYNATHDKFASRAIVSSLCGEMVDSLIFIPIAFIGQMPFKTLVIMGVTQVLLKVLYEIIILPITQLVIQKVATYEGV